MIFNIRNFIFLFLLLAGSKSFGDTLDKGLTINIICWNNGGGQTNDFKILASALSELGHVVKHVDYEANHAPKADINIFIERVMNKSLLESAKKNYFIPNAEWCKKPEQAMIKEFDLILCRTKETERIFHSITPKTYYLGFTSLDRQQKREKKKFDQFLHLKGRSWQKGTNPILKVWSKKPNFPQLTVLAVSGKNPKLENLEFKRTYVSEEALVKLQNSCGVHLCPSETEGFGHYISEAMSTGAVVVTTNAPPMNEFITDPRCLVKYKRTAPQQLATNYYVDQKDLEKVIEKLRKLPKKELRRIGRENRRRYLANKADFLQRLRVLFETKNSSV